jgi:hypothetical protein
MIRLFKRLEKKVKLAGLYDLIQTFKRFFSFEESAVFCYIL